MTEPSNSLIECLSLLISSAGALSLRVTIKDLPAMFEVCLVVDEISSESCEGARSCFKW